MKLVLKIGRKYFVHRYKWSHDDRRKKFLRMFKDGKVSLLQSTRDGWLYQIKGENNDNTTRSGSDGVGCVGRI